MRNIKKFARDFNLNYIESNNFVYIEINGVSFTIRRKVSQRRIAWNGKKNFSPKGYTVSNSEQIGRIDTLTQKDVVAEIIQTLLFTENVTKKEKTILNKYLLNL